MEFVVEEGASRADVLFLSLRSELIAMSGRFPLVQHHHIVASDWIDRFASRLGALLPGIDPTEASERGKASIPDAYECHPEQAAEIYATELPSLLSHELCDYNSAPPASWVLAYALEGASDAQLAAGLRAAQSALDSAGVSPFEAVHSQFRLEGWDDAGFPEELALTETEKRAHKALCNADSAAREAARPTGDEWGGVVARWPSKVRFEAARKRWLACQGLVT